MNSQEPKLELFGAPRLHVQNEVIDLGTDRPSLLLYYLATKGDWVSRGELAYLFYPELPEKKALTNLRKLIFRAQKHAEPSRLEITKMRVRWAIATDLKALEEAKEEQNWQACIEQYRGTFIESVQSGFYTYQDWLELKRSEFAEVYRESLKHLSKDLERVEHYEAAAETLAKLLKEDEFAEDVVQAYMSNLYFSGKSDEALKQFETYRQSLQAEMGMEPLDETLQLVNDIKNNTLFPTSKRLKHNLPSDITAFVGREDELESLAEQLRNPDCRLLTLIGLGGIGKTRLAIALLRQQLMHFEDGVYFLSATAISTKDALLVSLAQTLEFDLSPFEEPQKQVEAFLKDRKLLLCLDNFEHLLEYSALLSDLLKVSPQLKLIVTSRERLKLQSEWLFDVAGLAYPQDEDEAKPLQYDAVQLFYNALQRVLNRFEKSSSSLYQMAAICRMVEGFPLALELAANWARDLSLLQIREQIQQKLDFLSADLRDIPERQRSIRAVMENSWQRLEPEEQDLFSKLSLFRGRISLKASTEVTEANPDLLNALVDAFLLRRYSEDAFEMHELVRQFAYEKLEQDVSKHLEIQNRFTSYFVNFVNSGKQHLKSSQQQTYFTRYKAELNNIHAALDINLKAQNAEYCLELCSRIWYFWHRANYHQLGSSYLHRVLALKSKAGPAKAESLCGLGALYVVKSEFEAGTPFLQEALEMCQELGDARKEGEVFDILAFAAERQGKFELARSYHQKHYQLYKKHKFTLNVPLEGLARIAHNQYDYKTAKTYYHEALDIAEELGDWERLGNLHLNLASIFRDQGQKSKAQQHLGQAIEARIKVGGYEETYIQRLRADLALLDEDYARAKKLYLEVVRDSRIMEDNFRLATNLYHVISVAILEKNYKEASLYAQEALNICQAHRFDKLANGTHIYLARISYHLGNMEIFWQHSIKGLPFALKNNQTDVASYGFITLAKYLCKQQPDTALTLLAATKTLLDRINLIAGRNDQRTFDEITKSCQTMLRQRQFEAAWETGSKMNNEDMLEFVMSVFEQRKFS